MESRDEPWKVELLLYQPSTVLSSILSASSPCPIQPCYTALGPSSSGNTGPGTSSLSWSICRTRAHPLKEPARPRLHSASLDLPSATRVLDSAMPRPSQMIPGCVDPTLARSDVVRLSPCMEMRVRSSSCTVNLSQSFLCSLLFLLRFLCSVVPVLQKNVVDLVDAETSSSQPINAVARVPLLLPLTSQTVSLTFFPTTRSMAPVLYLESDMRPASRRVVGMTKFLFSGTASRRQAHPTAYHLHSIPLPRTPSPTFRSTTAVQIPRV